MERYNKNQMLVFQLLASLVLFLLACFFVFYLPGFLILKLLNIKLEKFEELSLSLTVGLVSFTLLSFLLGYLQLRFLSFPILVLVGIGAVLKFKLEFFRPFSWQVWRPFKPLLLLLGVGMPVQLIINFLSGWPYKDGIYFWSSHGHDGTWHLALMEELKDFFPAQSPIFAGEALKNYHYFVDLVMAEFGRLFGFSSLDLYFRMFPLLFSLLIGLNVFIFAYKWRHKLSLAYWAVFFTFLTGSFGYFVDFLQHRDWVGGETIFWVAQPNTVLGNPPHAVSFGVVAAFLFCFIKYLKEKKNALLFLSVLLAGVLIEFKVYAGMIILGGLLVTGVFEFLLKRPLRAIKVFIFGLPLSFLVYLPSSTGSSEFLIWQPWWYIRTMVVAPDRLNWIDLEFRRQHYVSLGTWRGFIRALQMEGTAFLIFLGGNLGMRVLGFWELFKQLIKWRKIETFDFFLGVCVVGSFVAPLLFLQKGVAWNTIQFMQYFIYLFGFLAAATVDEITHQKSKFKRFVLIGLILVFSIPTVLGNVVGFGPSHAFSRLPYPELEALNELKRISQREDVILTHPFEKYAHMGYQVPIPLYAWDSTAYVAFFAGRRTYLTGENQAEILGHPREERLKKIEKFFLAKDLEEARELLKSFDIDYLYLVKDQSLGLEPDELGLKKVFENNWSRIYQVQ